MSVVAYLDFYIEVTDQEVPAYQIAVRSKAGEARTLATFPYTSAELETELQRLENAILYPQIQTRRRLMPHEEAVRDFGARFFEFLLPPGEARSLYYECRRLAEFEGKGLRINLLIQPPQLAALPWEFLHDPRRRDYVALDPYTPLVRYPELAQSATPLQVTPPLRILGLVANPSNLRPLDVEMEKQQVTKAIQPLLERGLVELTWLPGQSWRDLQHWMRPGYGPWHIFHFIGHGEFDPYRDEGRIFLTDDRGWAQGISATQLSRLLAFQRGTLRLAVLNSCEGARGGKFDALSSTAATLVLGGLPAVLAMQYEITDDAALEFARTFYGALADNLPVDAAVADARNAMNLHDEDSLEWGTPVLFMRAADGQLFAIDQRARPLPTAATVTETPPASLPHPTVPPPAVNVTRPSLDFAWITIPAVEFRMGSDKAKDEDAYDDELPQHRFYLPEYRIARVPVTVAQFAQFIKATGYQTTAELEGAARVWTGGQWEDIQGADWAHPRGPQSDVTRKENHPVTCVSWYDAVAFCQWANVRLPTEAEWEKAARGTDGRLYPWGNDPPNKERCNFGMNVQDTTPVGTYPKGASPYKVLDMAGNVWEWTVTKWVAIYTNYAERADNTLTGDEPRTLRGGAWDNLSYGVRAAYRNRDLPSSRSSNVGFRVVASVNS